MKNLLLDKANIPVKEEVLNNYDLSETQREILIGMILDIK